MDMDSVSGDRAQPVEGLVSETMLSNEQQRRLLDVSAQTQVFCQQ